MIIQTTGQMEPKSALVSKISSVFNLSDSPVLIHEIFVESVGILHGPMIHDNKPGKEVAHRQQKHDPTRERINQSMLIGWKEKCE